MTADALFAVADPPQRRPWGEALAVSAAVLAGFALLFQAGMTGNAIGGAARVAAVLMILVSAATDFKWCRIFNWTTYTAFGWAVAFGILADSYGSTPVHHGSEIVPLAQAIGVDGLCQVLTGFGLCFAGMFTLFTVFGGGAGDVKFIAALGGLVGWEGGLYTWVYGCLAAAVFTVGVVMVRIGPRAILAELFFKLGLVKLCFLLGGPSGETKKLFSRRIPMGPFFAIGSVFALSR